MDNIKIISVNKEIRKEIKSLCEKASFIDGIFKPSFEMKLALNLEKYEYSSIHELIEEKYKNLSILFLNVAIKDYFKMHPDNVKGETIILYFNNEKRVFKSYSSLIDYIKDSNELVNKIYNECFYHFKKGITGILPVPKWLEEKDVYAKLDKEEDITIETINEKIDNWNIRTSQNPKTINCAEEILEYMDDLNIKNNKTHKKICLEMLKLLYKTHLSDFNMQLPYKSLFECFNNNEGFEKNLEEILSNAEYLKELYSFYTFIYIDGSVIFKEEFDESQKQKFKEYFKED